MRERVVSQSLNVMNGLYLIGAGVILDQLKDVSYDLFISYYTATGGDLAEFLKKRLIDFGVNAFLDKYDIPENLIQDNDEWRRIVNEAIISSPVFVLLMTLNFHTRKEVLRELKLAKNLKKRIIYCKHVDLPNTMLRVDLDGQSVDLADYHYEEFDNENDLLRELGARLLGMTTAPSSYFETQISTLMKCEGSSIRELISPTVEMFIGSEQDCGQPLEPNQENRFLMSISPYCRQNPIAYRKWFDCETSPDVFFRVHTNGFFHILESIPYDTDGDLIYYDSIISEISEALIYVARILKYKNIIPRYKIQIIVRNIAGRTITYDRYRWFTRYVFSKDLSDSVFTYIVDPTDDWSEIKELLLKICKDIYLESGNVNITDSVITLRLCRVLNDLRSLHTSYRSSELGITIPLLDASEFGFSEEEIRKARNPTD